MVVLVGNDPAIDSYCFYQLSLDEPGINRGSLQVPFLMYILYIVSVVAREVGFSMPAFVIIRYDDLL